ERGGFDRAGELPAGPAFLANKPRVAGGLSRSRLRPVEQADLHPLLGELVGRRQADDPSSEHYDIGPPWRLVGIETAVQTPQTGALEHTVDCHTAANHLVPPSLRALEDYNSESINCGGLHQNASR